MRTVQSMLWEQVSIIGGVYRVPDALPKTSQGCEIPEYYARKPALQAVKPTLPHLFQLLTILAISGKSSENTQPVTESQYPRNFLMLHFSTAAMRRILCLALAIGFLSTSLLADDFGKPTRQEKRISQIVARLMQQHLSNRKLNDAISQRALNMFLKNLDPMKVYFVQSDIDEFQEKYRDSLDDMLKDGDYAAAFDIFGRFLERIEERVKLANQLIGTEHDYEVEEELITERDMIQYAETAEEIEDRWRKRIKYNLLVFRSDDDEEEASTTAKTPEERLGNRYRAFANRMKQFDNEDVIEMYISAITTSFDPHTSYMSRSSYVNFQINMSLELEGIGATLQSTDDGLTVIRRIVPGGAADKSGKIKVEDKIVAVGQGDDGEMIDIVDMKLDDVVEKIRGKAGTTVRLGVMSPGSGDIKTISIVRERIELKDSEAQGQIFVVEQEPGPDYRIGVIDLPSFYTDMQARSRGVADYKSTTRDVNRILEEFNAEGVDAVVLDLRKNGGGSLTEAVDCTGLFIDRGPVVQVKDPYGQIEALNDHDFGMAWEGPLVVLTSKFSASASEILAGAVQDYERGLVIGDTATHGKGTVQTMLNLAEVLLQTRNAPPSLGALKITISQFYRPNGDSTQKRGVLSDIVLPSITDHMDVSESDLEYPVEFDRVAEASYPTMDQTNADLIGKLTQRSDDRIDSSDEFQRELRRIARYIEQKEENSVSLNADDFNERRAEMDADKEEEKLIEDTVNHSSTEIERDFYMDEVLNIAADYVRVLTGTPLANNN
ncbi:MAG: carboxy terminal-processing peptidase [Pirellulaceae bacterium]